METAMMPENRDLETGREDNEDERSLEIEEYEQIFALLQGSQGSQGSLGEEKLIQNTASRLALLEQHFARICTVVGKLEQEIRLLKGKMPDEQL